MPDCNNIEESEMIQKAREYLSTYDDMEELIRLGAYRAGSNPKVDEAIEYYDQLDPFIAQEKDLQITFEDGFENLAMILGCAEDMNPELEETPDSDFSSL